MKTSHRPLRTNWVETPCKEAWKPSGLVIKPLHHPPAVSTFNPETVPAPRTLQTEKKLFLPFSPPRFRIPKKGPNAGQPVEEKMCIIKHTRTVIAGGKRWESTATLSKGIPKPPATADGTAFSKVFQDLAGRYDSLTADRLQNFLRFAEYA